MLRFRSILSIFGKYRQKSKRFIDSVKHRLITWAVKLDNSRKQKELRKRVEDILNNPSNPKKRYLDIFIIVLIISSVFIMIYEVKHPLPLWMDIYDIYFVSLIFLIEYILRLWISSDMTSEFIEEYNKATFLGREFKVLPALARGLKKKLEFMITPAAIIDLLAILPAYRPLRVLRIFVLFRFLKLLRYTRSINQFVEVLSNKRFELLTLLLLLLFVMMTGAIAIYVLEDMRNPDIKSMFDAIYWSLVTISTVGYGDISPVSDMGRVIAMIIILFGIAMISFATSVIVSAFSEKLHTLKEERIIDEINKSEEFLIICGYGQMSKMFFRQFSKIDFKYIILDKNPERVKEALHDGYDAIVDDASRHETLARFDTNNSRVTVMCMTHDDVENIYITLNAKNISPKIKVIARAGSENIVNKYRRAGADHILLPNETASTMMAVAIMRPTMYKAIDAIFSGKNVAMLDEVIVHSHGHLLGKKIKDIDFKHFKLIPIGIQKQNEKRFIFNPDPEIVLEHRDVLLVMGDKRSISYFIEISCKDRC
jgi:voltage-gated potassium channel